MTGQVHLAHPDHRAQGPAQAGRDLAELANRLRLSVAAAPGGAAPAWAGRFAAAALCWRQLGRECRLADFAALAAGLDELAAVLAQDCGLDPAATARLAAVDAGLTALLERHDAGVPGAELCALPEWGALGPGRAAPVPGPAGPAGDRAVALLVASPFLQGILVSRLDAAGRLAATVATPEALLPLLAGPRPPVLVVCDNDEPTNHLRRLRRLLGGRAAPALILVASAGGTVRGRERRARAVGADAVWPEPWRVEQLPGAGTAGGST